MELNLTKALTIALLGLGTIIPPSYSVPTGLSQILDIRSYELFYLPEALFRRVPAGGNKGGSGDKGGSGNGRGTPKLVDIETEGYKVQGDTHTINSDEYTVFSVNKVDGLDKETNIDAIRIDKIDKAITFQDLNNDLDPKPDRLGLFSIAASLWIFSSKMAAKDLTKVHADNVENDELVAIVQAYQKDNENDQYPTVNSASTGKQLNLYEDIMKARLTGSVKSLNSLLGTGKTFGDIEINAGDEDQFSITWNLK